MIVDTTMGMQLKINLLLQKVVLKPIIHRCVEVTDNVAQILFILILNMVPMELHLYVG